MFTCVLRFLTRIRGRLTCKLLLSRLVTSVLKRPSRRRLLRILLKNLMRSAPSITRCTCRLYCSMVHLAMVLGWLCYPLTWLMTMRTLVFYLRLVVWRTRAVSRPDLHLRILSYSHWVTGGSGSDCRTSRARRVGTWTYGTPLRVTLMLSMTIYYLATPPVIGLQTLYANLDTGPCLYGL